MSVKNKCKQCEEEKRQGLKPVRFKDKQTVCSVCKKSVDKVLDLHHTTADICSLSCEMSFWLDIFF